MWRLIWKNAVLSPQPSVLSNSQTFHAVPCSFLHHLGLTEMLAVILLYHPTSRHGDILSNESLGDFITVWMPPSLLTGTEMVWPTTHRGCGHRCHREAHPQQKGHSAPCALPFPFQRISPVASVHHAVAVMKIALPTLGQSGSATHVFLTFWDRGSLCNQDWLCAHSDPPASDSQVLECRLTHSFECHWYKREYVNSQHI